MNQTHKSVLLLGKSPRTVAQVFILNIIVEILGYIGLWLYFLSFGIQVSILDFIFAISILAVINMIPGAPTKLGQAEFFSLLTLPFLLRLDPNQVLAVMLFHHLVGIMLMLATGWGAILLMELIYNINPIATVRAKYRRNE